MPTVWDPDLYLKFTRERVQPSIDLVHRIEIDSPETVLDVGCGPGNSTAVLWNRWPKSRITGLDNSSDMIAKAKHDYPDRDWQLGDPRHLPATSRYDVVYSNAVIQWIPDHAALIRRLVEMVNPGGALAVQVPLYDGMPVRRVIAEVAQGARFRDATTGADALMYFHDAGFYYDLLSSCAERITMWETAYLHEMESHEMIVEMIRSTGMRPYLERLESEEDRTEFLTQVRSGVSRAYPMQRNGRVLFPFNRLFFIAYRAS